jgi:hypothetical protein
LFLYIKWPWVRPSKDGWCVDRKEFSIGFWFTY